MIYFIQDHGSFLWGWLLPDNPGTVPRITLCLDQGRRREQIESTLERADVKAANLHPTGLCGFHLKDGDVDGYVSDMPLEIYEADSNILMYRRAEQTFAKAQIYHLETQTFPVYPLGRPLGARIQMIYSNIELIGDQSRAYLIHTPFDSLLISGAALYPTMQPFLTPAFVKCVLLSDPLREVASRLMLAKALAAVREEGATWRTLGMDDLIDVVVEADLTDPRALARALNKMSDETFYALANPTTRKLVSKLHTDKIGAQHLGSALDTLADFQVIGFDDALDTYRRDLTERLDLDAFPPATESEPAGLAAVMATLRLCAISDELVDLDRAVLDTARSAFQSREEVPPAVPRAAAGANELSAAAVEPAKSES